MGWQNSHTRQVNKKSRKLKVNPAATAGSGQRGDGTPSLDRVAT